VHTLVDIAQALQIPLTDLIPETDNVEMLLRDKTQKGVDWVKSSTIDLKR
jgi:hypothetical protein